MAGGKDGKGLVTMQVGLFQDWMGGCVVVPAFFRSRDGLSLGAVCITASAVVEGWGTVFVDIPTSLSGRGSSSQGAVWITALAEVVVVWVLKSTRLAVSASLSISASVILTSRPSSNPSSYPSSQAVIISCCTLLWP